MIIIHIVGDFLGELFPRYKSSGFDEEILKEELIEYYTYRIFRPTVDIKDGFVTINIDTERITNEMEEYKAVVKLCEQGQYDKAKPRLTSLIQKNPTNSEYHRILGQIYSDEGEQELAIDTLIDALRWNPKNTHALTMMGNILAKHKNDIPTALKYYNQAIAINPKDSIAITNIGVNLMRQGKIEEAKTYCEKALSVDPEYPNIHYTLAMLAEMENDLNSAFFNATQALKKSKNKDGVYQQALNLAVHSAKLIIGTRVGEKIFKEYLHKLEFEGGTRIELEMDNSISTTAKMEFSENYNREHHLIRYKEDYPAKEHLMAHELAHLQLVLEARKEGVNQLFTATQIQREHFIQEESEWIKKIKKLGLTEQAVSKTINLLFEGLNLQIYNTPIDLFIEDFLYNEFPALRPYQFISLNAMIKEGIKAVTDKQVVELSSKRILYVSKIYNIISTIHFKNLFGVDLISEINATRSEILAAEKMYGEFKEYRDDRVAGEEYELVQNWAKDLKIDDIFELIEESEYRNKRTVDTVLASIEDDPYDLKSDQTFKKKETETFIKSQKEIGINMAVVMFMVDAMEYFQRISIDEVKSIAHEIMYLGIHGINPNNKGYKVGLIPDKSFSGYHLLAYYYVSWAIAEPKQLELLELPFKNEYGMAKKMFRPTV